MFKVIFATALLGAAVATSAVDAKTMQAVYTGTVTLGFDETGEFGSAQTDLTGETYSLTFRYDTALGSRDTQSFYDQLYGGSAYPIPSPFLSVVLKIGSVAQTMLADYTAAALNYDYGAGTGGFYSTHTAQHYTVDPLTGGYTYSLVSDIGYDPDATSYFDLDTPFTLTGLPGYSGSFQLNDYDPTTGIYARYAYGSLQASGLTVTDVTLAPVPLPTPALLLLAGVAGLGGLRSRRRKTCKAA